MRYLLITTVAVLVFRAASGLQVFGDSKSHDDAKASCEAKGMTLALDTSADTHSAIISALSSNGYGGTDVWINGEQNGSGAWVDSDGTALGSYQPWAWGEPNGSGGCLQIWAGAGNAWDDTPCWVTKPYVCDDTTTEPSDIQVFGDSKNFADAQASCIANGMILVKDLSDSIHSQITSLLSSKGYQNTDVWINGQQKSDNTWVTTEGDELTGYTAWTWGEPNGSGRCLQLWAGRGHAWDDTPCSVTKPYVCGPADAEVDPSLKLFDGPSTQDDAQATCEANGMTLAKDLSEEKHSAIIKEILRNGLIDTDIWINGKQGSGNQWETNDGIPLTSYQPWVAGEPNGSGRCLQMWAARDLQWDDTPCTVTKPFVCEVEAAPKTEPPPTEAPPTEAPPTEAPPTEAPKTEAPPHVGETTMIPTLAPCEFPVALSNVAVGKAASQSSDKKKKDSAPENAVDGNKDGDAKKGGSCSWTDKEYQPWWKVDLGQTYDIYEVVITNREDCCNFRIKNAEIRVGDSENFEENPVCGMMILGKMAKQQPIHIRCGCDIPMKGRHVSIQLIDKEQQLTLCEVEVMVG